MAEGRCLKDEVFPSQQLLLLWDATENREKWGLIHSPACRLLILPWLGLPLQQTSDHWDPQLEASRICQSVRNWRNSHLDSWIETTETAQIRVSSFQTAAKGAAEGKTRTLHNEGSPSSEKLVEEEQNPQKTPSMRITECFGWKGPYRPHPSHQMAEQPATGTGSQVLHWDTAKHSRQICMQLQWLHLALRLLKVFWNFFFFNILSWWYLCIHD